MLNAKAVVSEALLVAAAGLVFAVAANALSPRGLRLSQDYFPAAGRPLVVAPTATPSVGAPATPNTPNRSNATLARLRERGLQLATREGVVELFRDPRYEQGLVAFIDARDDRPYKAGHIPGAWQFDHYRAEKFLSTILPVCLVASQVVVYCNGGECEDSELAALMLRDLGVPSRSLFVFAGGITEWTAHGMPVETGSRRSGVFIPSKP